jgi:sulfur-oxidizing protein SoxB
MPTSHGDRIRLSIRATVSSWFLLSVGVGIAEIAHADGSSTTQTQAVAQNTAGAPTTATTAITPTKATQPTTRTTPPAVKTITLIHLNDLHANLVPHDDLIRVKASDDGPATARVEERGGIARIATLIRKIRAQHGSSILMNIGDTYHGGVEALYTRGNAIVPAVNALGIDVGVPGNWDFAYGAVTTRMRYSPEPSIPARLFNWLFWGDAVQRPNFPNLAANLKQTMPPLARGELLMPGTLVREVDGLRIGFIGLTSDMVPRMAPVFAWGFDFLQGEENYRRLINDSVLTLREDGAEVVVVMSELGLHRDRRLADVVEPGVDVIFSAHTHEVTRVPLESASGAIVVEAGNDAYLGTMELHVEDGVVVDHNWNLIAVDASLAKDPIVQALVEEARAPFLVADVKIELPVPWIEMPLTRPIDTVVGHSDRLLHRRDVLHNPFNAMFAEALRREAGTEIGMTPGFRFDAVISPRSKGPGGALDGNSEITIERLYRYLPIAPGLATGKIRGKRLREILELELTRVFSLDPFEHSGGWLGGFAGLDLEVDLSRPDGKRITRLSLMGSREPIGDDEMLTVASCIRPFDDDDIMCSNPGYEEIVELENPATGRTWTPLEFLAHAFEAGLVPVAENSRVVDRGGEALWPEAPYVQPLREGGRVER